MSEDNACLIMSVWVWLGVVVVVVVVVFVVLGTFSRLGLLSEAPGKVLTRNQP